MFSQASEGESLGCQPRRYELEKGLVEGSVQVADLPRLWNERMTSFLGCTPKDDAQGVLQDVHWCALPGGWPPVKLLKLFLT